MWMRFLLFVTVAFFISFNISFAEPSKPEKKPTHAIALYGDIKYGADATHFDYVNPNAPKGGTFRWDAVGTFDSLNPFIIKGQPASGLQYLHGGIFYAALTLKSNDEPFTEYAYIAEKIEVAKDKKSMTYTLRKEARFHDGSPIRAEDVVFTFYTLMKKGSPTYRNYYHDVVKVEKTGEHQVTFYFKGAHNKELPLIIGEMPIISEAFYKNRDFEQPSLEIPPGTGPYRIVDIHPGHSITYERVKDWWGKDLLIAKGRYNFDKIKIIYFRDAEVAFEGFKSGDYDFRVELSAKNWAKRYDFPAYKRGDVIRKQWDQPLYSGMTMLSFNIRRDIFKDRRVRHAIAILYDFEWTNKNVLYGMYKERPMSFFAGSELAQKGVPSKEELKILEPYKNDLPKELFTSEFKMPLTKGDGNIRPLIREAEALLKEAGYEIQNGVMVHLKTKKPLTFQILATSPDSEKLLQGFIKNLDALGVKAGLKLVESAQYVQLVNNFNYDMVGDASLQSSSPGNEQREFWGSESANRLGSRNLIGIQNKVVDALIEKLIDSQTREDLVNHTRALDRVLMWDYYVVPLIRHADTRVAYWRKMQLLPDLPKYGIDLYAWWIDVDIEKALDKQDALVSPSVEKEESWKRFLSMKHLLFSGLILLGGGLFWRIRRRKKDDRRED